MIDRTQVHFCLRPRTLLIALGTSCSLFLILLIAWAIAVFAGAVAFAAIWLVVLVVGLFFYGIVVVGALAFAGGGIAIANEQGSDKGGWAVIIGLGIGGVILYYGFPWANQHMGDFAPPYMATARSGWDTCLKYALMFLDVFTGYKVYIYSWTVFVAALLAAASVLCFLGVLRCETSVKAALLKIRYSCPKCHSQALPLFCCSNPTCSFAHDDLKPTIYGIWNATCSKCGELLPASDLAGRLKLKSICRQKGCDPDFSSLGAHSEYHLAVVGASNSGKTNLMIMAVRQLIESFAPSHGLTVHFANLSEQHEFNQKVRDLDNGQVLAATVRVETPMAFNLVLEHREGPSCNLYIYDAAGEDFQTGDAALTGHLFHRYIDAILLIVDPAAEEDLRRQYPDVAWSTMNPARENISVIEGRMIPFWERALGVGSGRPFSVPLAVVVTKMDALTAHFTRNSEEMQGAYADMEMAAEAACQESAHVRQFLIEGGLGNIVQNIESRFPLLAYFTVSALGRSSKLKNRTAFRPEGVLAPLFWACYSSGALTDASTVRRSMHHLGRYTCRMLAAKEGVWAALALWSVIVTAAASFVMLLWYRLAIWGLVSGLSGIAVTSLFLYVQFVLSTSDRQRFRHEFNEAMRRLRDRFVGRHGKRPQFLVWSSSFFIVAMLLVAAWSLWWPLVFVVLIVVMCAALLVGKSS